MAQTVKVKAFHRHLHRWYQQHGRKELPWRNADAYGVYISEVMLQQTQVKTVLERYYFPFLKRFPTLKALADAPQEDVLRAWQGLGYYNRAINLHKAAKKIRASDLTLQVLGKERFPEPEARSLIPYLMALPGIGRNTAHAIATFAYKQAVPVMEANVKRVLSRIYALNHPTEEILWEKAHALLDTKNPFDYNQAMMDIGALVCKKSAPHCNDCPASAICKGKTSPESYPAPKAKKAVPVRKQHIAVLHSGGKYFAAPRRTKFLNGLYHFVEFDLSSRRRPGSHAATQRVAEDKIPAFAGMTKIGSIRQQYSHFILEAEVVLVDAKAWTGKDWYSLAQLKKLPMSMAEKKILALLEQHSTLSSRTCFGTHSAKHAVVKMKGGC